MRRYKTMAAAAVGCWLAILSGFGSKASADGPCQVWVSKIVSIQGQVLTMRHEQPSWQPVQLHDTFCAGDRVLVGTNSRAAIVLNNDSVLRVDQNTTLIFNGIEEKGTFLMELIKGAIHFFSRKARSLSLTTPFANGLVKGTEFYVNVDEKKTQITLFEGRLFTQNTYGGLLLAQGQSAAARSGQPPRREIVARPRDAVQWALYYPPILSFDPAWYEAAPPGSWQSQVRQSMVHARQGDLGQAFAQLEGLDDTPKDPNYWVYRAGLALSVGRVEEARRQIGKVLAVDPADSTAMALQAIIAVVQNRKEEAVGYAQNAVSLDPSSAAARIALSYAYQAGFDLEAALDQAGTAARLSPDNTVAWSRLAEMRLAAGDLEGALTAAGTASRLDAHTARTQTVLGFAYLAQIKIGPAKLAFTRAIEIDSAAPLPRLGLGLARIREGDLKQGRANIEIAAGLDPGNALIRSYLGKAYYEEKRAPLDQQQFDIAKELDPHDPTSYFYDALRKQSKNQPAQALKDLENAIALNSHRAVYRSRLLLDKDLASRSAALSRIYQNLNFQELALRQGYTSLQIDPANFSAHRLLADSYASRSRHDVARVSELLQAQLLQPVNITPVQPQLAETNLFVLNDAGPAEPCMHELNPLFLRDRIAFQASAVAGSNDTKGDEAVISAVQKKVSLSVGQYFYETDGFRENNDLRHEIYDAFAQIDLSYKISLQGEIRYRDTQRGDLLLRFDPDAYSETIRKPQKITSGRLGAHYAPTPDSNLLGSWIYTDTESEFNDPPFIAAEVLDHGYIAEIQHLFRGKAIRLTSGAGYLNAKRKYTFEVPTVFQLEESSTLENLFGYVYGYLNLPLDITWTVGLNTGNFRGFVDQAQINPKLGISWKILQNTTLRAAAFRVLEDTLIAKQRLEPTHVAGFNQFYEDLLDGSEAIDVWSYGIGLDHRLSPILSGGVEMIRRELDVPYVDLYTTGDIHEVAWEEETLRLYCYAGLLDWLTASIVYQYESFQREAEFTGEDTIVDLDTHRLSIGTRMFSDTGIFAGAKATYVDQKGKFGMVSDFDSGQDHFWVFDATVGYRLPRRYGMITIEGKNIFNQSFHFQDTDPTRPSVYPDQQILIKLTLSF